MRGAARVDAFPYTILSGCPHLGLLGARVDRNTERPRYLTQERKILASPAGMQHNISINMEMRAQARERLFPLVRIVGAHFEIVEEEALYVGSRPIIVITMREDMQPINRRFSNRPLYIQRKGPGINGVHHLAVGSTPVVARLRADSRYDNRIAPCDVLVRRNRRFIMPHRRPACCTTSTARLAPPTCRHTD